jgi:hypothetical protein
MMTKKRNGTMTKKAMLKHRAEQDRSALSSVLYALDFFAPTFITPDDVANLTKLPLDLVMRSLRQLLARNPHIECDDVGGVFRVRSKNLNIRKRKREASPVRAGEASEHQNG